jgi:hypothetical protein
MFIRGLEIRDPERAEAISAIWTAVWKRDLPVCFRLGEVRLDGEREREREKIERERQAESVESVEGEEDEKEAEVAEEEANRARNTQRVELAKPRPLNANDTLVGCARGAKMYILLNKNVGQRTGEEWLRRKMQGEGFRGLGKKKAVKLLEALEARRLEREERKQRREAVKLAGVKRKITIRLRTGSVFEKDRTAAREEEG